MIRSGYMNFVINVSNQLIHLSTVPPPVVIKRNDDNDEIILDDWEQDPIFNAQEERQK